MATRTIKLVIIGESGVGKTSFRGQYISGQFSTGYKATIGTDFISKSLPHYKNPEESVTLQIWDTAGQERFSSLAAAFFRGADAVVLMFDVNKPETLGGLGKWWQSFRERAPVPEGEEEDYCCVFVGNKVDLAEAAGAGDAAATAAKGRETVSEARAESFMEELIPRKTANAVSPDDGPESDGEGASSGGDGDDDDDDNAQLQPSSNGHADPAIEDALSRHSPPKSDSIQIYRSDASSSHPYAKKAKAHKPELPQQQQRESSQVRGRKRLVSPSSRSVDRLLSHLVVGGGGGGTMTTTHTIYHTPSSSLFESESFASAQSSMYSSMSSVNATHLAPELAATAEAAAPPASVSVTSDASPSPGPAPLQARRLTSASSSSSAPTITPSLYHRAHNSSSAAVSQPSPLSTPPTSGGELPVIPSSEPPRPASSLSPNATAVLEANGNTDPRFHQQHHQHGLPPHPDRRPKLFFTSAKTGAGVAGVFEYVARRVVMKWEYEEALEARRMHVRDATETTIRLAEARRRGKSLRGGLAERVSCCSS